MNIPEGATPFNLQAALAGAKTICRDGSPGPVEFHVLPEWAAGTYGRVKALFPGGEVNTYSIEGKYVFEQESGADLFMAPVEKEITAWAVVDKNGKRRKLCSEEPLKNELDYWIGQYPAEGPFSIVPLTGKWKG